MGEQLQIPDSGLTALDKAQIHLAIAQGQLEVATKLSGLVVVATSLLGALAIPAYGWVVVFAWPVIHWFVVKPFEATRNKAQADADRLAFFG